MKYKWYVDDVPGRSGIAIHGGKTGENTLGCFLPGDTVEYNNQTKSYEIKKSPIKKDALFDFFDKYGRNGIKINVGL